jgi:methyltransferase
MIEGSGSESIGNAGIWLIGFVALQRLAELTLARRNTSALLAGGGIEYGAGHYPLMVALHAAWLIGLAALGWDRPVSPFWLGVFVVLQFARIWIIGSLGPLWTTRIVVLPGAPPVETGPYRFLRHPNYAVVALEIAVVPLALGLWAFAAVFFVLNLALLTVRIRCEDRALTIPNRNLAKPERRL